MAGYGISLGIDQTTPFIGHIFMIFEKPDLSFEKYGFYKGEDGNIHFENEDIYGVDEFGRSESIPITKDQFDKMKQFAENFSPEYSNLGFPGENCMTAAVKTLEAGGININLSLKYKFWPWTLPLGPLLDKDSNTSYLASRTFAPRRDPLAPRVRQFAPKTRFFEGFPT